MLKQTLQQKLLQKLSPQQIQLMKLLQVPTVELEQRIKEELEANPALDEGVEKDEEFEEFEEEEESRTEEEFDISEYLSDDDTPDYKLSVNNKGVDDDDKDVPLGSGSTFRDLLISQLGLRKLDQEQRMLAENLIGNLDDDGYLRREIAAIVNDLAFSQNIMTTSDKLEEILVVIQDFDPPGVGARDLRECLLIQINRVEREEPSVDLARVVLDKFFESFSKKHYDKITRRLGITDEELKGAVEEIVRLNPKPGNSLQGSAKIVQHVVPDFIVVVEDDELRLTLNQRNAPDLKVSRQYKQMLETYASQKSPDKKSKEAIMFVKQKIDGAKWFIDAIRQRQQTLLFTMNAILDYQEAYFLTGDETKIKPMILKDIAEIVQMDISTISRVANSKYVQCPYGTFLLKTFFSESLSTDSGEEVSTREVKKILQESIDGEEKRRPLTDEKLAKVLKDQGYKIARRTVAKYREQLGIPVARLRKEL
jgi:RNA polymerase sigma-54 factor